MRVTQAATFASRSNSPARPAGCPGRGLPLPLVHQRNGPQPYRHRAPDLGAKLLMMLQALVSLLTLVLVAARAVNVLA
jgi:hypothetical protein